jgi:hypothetical protein
MAACCIIAVAGAAAGQPGKAGAADASLVRVPPGALVVARTSVGETRAFPEMASTTEGREFAKAEKVVGTEQVDTVYQVEKAYDVTVAFFDQQFKQPGFQVLARTVTQTATAWTVRRPDRTLASVVVRTTTPSTTFEIAQSDTAKKGILSTP